jgi:hypothetical protein
MTTYEDDQREELEYTSACVRTALKRYNRTRSIKNATLAIVAFLAFVLPMPAISDWVPWLSKFVELARSNIVAWYVGILVVLLYGYTEQRLRTMQVRLATMHDLLHRIAGDSAEERNELLMELVAEVGPVEPDPKLWPARE